MDRHHTKKNCPAAKSAKYALGSGFRVRGGKNLVPANPYISGQLQADATISARKLIGKHAPG